MASRTHRRPARARACPPTQEKPPQVRAPMAGLGNAEMIERLGLKGGAQAQPAASQTAERFIALAEAHDTEGLFGLFHEDATFSDPIFGDQDAMGNLGKLGTEHDGSGAVITYEPAYEVIPLDDGGARVVLEWQADYELFGSSIHNEVTTTLTLDASGAIRSQVDVYDRDAWLAQAFPWMSEGFSGWTQRYVLTPFLEWKMPRAGADMLEDYQDPSR